MLHQNRKPAFLLIYCERYFAFSDKDRKNLLCFISNLKTFVYPARLSRFFLLLLMTIFFLSVKKRFLTDKTLADGRFITAQIEIVIIYWLPILEKI